MFRFHALVIAASASSAALAQPAEHRLGEHPAVIVKRLEASRGYDYPSKFYPHPAWLYLSSVPPDVVLQAAAARRPPAADVLAARQPVATPTPLEQP